MGRLRHPTHRVKRTNISLIWCRTAPVLYQKRLVPMTRISTSSSDKNGCLWDWDHCSRLHPESEWHHSFKVYTEKSLHVMNCGVDNRNTFLRIKTEASRPSRRNEEIKREGLTLTSMPNLLHRMVTISEHLIPYHGLPRFCNNVVTSSL